MKTLGFFTALFLVSCGSLENLTPQEAEFLEQGAIDGANRVSANPGAGTAISEVVSYGALLALTVMGAAIRKRNRASDVRKTCIEEDIEALKAAVLKTTTRKK